MVFKRRIVDDLIAAVLIVVCSACGGVGVVQCSRLPQKCHLHHTRLTQSWAGKTAQGTTIVIVGRR